MTDTAMPPAGHEAPAAPAIPKYIDNGRPRFRTVPLEWPVEFEGKVYSEVTVRRMTASEVGEFIDAIRTDGSKAFLPMFDVPQAVIDALDDDDGVEVNKAVQDFLPRRLREANEEQLAQPTGEPTSP
jgi:hypothetical protein